MNSLIVLMCSIDDDSDLRSPLNDEAFKNIYFTQDASQVDHILSAHIEVCAHVELTFLVRQPHTAPLRDIDDLPNLPTTRMAIFIHILVLIILCIQTPFTVPFNYMVYSPARA